MAAAVLTPKRGGSGLADDEIKQSPPLDLTNKSPEHHHHSVGKPTTENNNDDISKKQQFAAGIESHFNLLKMKELELLKNAVVSGGGGGGGSGGGNVAVNRCNECNINFSKYQNYLAHKKYYCSGVKQQGQTGGLDLAEETTETKPTVPQVNSSG